jgi:hypothetical protein
VYLRRPCLRPSRHQRIRLYSKWRGRPPTKRSGFLEVIDPIVVMAALADSTSYLLIDFILRGHSERNCQGTARRCPRSHRAGPHRPERSSSTPTIAISTWSRRTAGPSATALRWERRPRAGPASPKSAAWPSGRVGPQLPVSSSALARSRRMCRVVAEPNGRARPVPLRRWQGHAVPDPWHQPAGIYRPSDLVGLNPPHQRGRDRPLHPGEARHPNG